MATKRNPFGPLPGPTGAPNMWAPPLPKAPAYQPYGSLPTPTGTPNMWVPPALGGGGGGSGGSGTGLGTPTHPGSIVSFNPAPAATPAATVDYRANILNDPIYQQQMAALSASGIADTAARKASIDRALINFGEIPNFTNAISGLGISPGSDLFASLGEDVDAATRKAAAGLTAAGLSTSAKLTRGHVTAMDNLMSTLAARGIVRSGATGVGTNLEDTNYRGAQYDARQQLLDYLSGVQAAWAQSQATLQQQKWQYLQDAAGRQGQMNPAGTTTTTTDTTPKPKPPPPVVQPSGGPQRPGGMY